MAAMLNYIHEVGPGNMTSPLLLKQGNGNWVLGRDSVKCGCGRRMRTADADGGRRMADGGRTKKKKIIEKK